MGIRDRATAASMIRKGKIDQSTTDKIDKIVLNRWLGIPIFLFIMYLMIIFSINIGSAFIDFFDILFGAIFVPVSYTHLAKSGIRMNGMASSLCVQRIAMVNSCLLYTSAPTPAALRSARPAA